MEAVEAVLTFNIYDYDEDTTYLQWVDKYGYIKWNEPKIIADGPETQNYAIDIFSNDDGTYLFGYISGYTYIDSNLTQFAFFEPYIQKIDSSGNKLWGEYGIRLNPNSLSQRVGMDLCSDGDGGIYAFWRILPNEYPDIDSLFIQHISKDGERLWGDTGIFIDDSIFDALNSWVIGDDSGGIYIQYRKKNTEYYINKFNSSGNLDWTLSIPNNFSKAIKDSYGGIVISGVVDSYPSNKIIINRISSEGERLWGEDGIIVDDSVDNNLGYPAEIFLNSDNIVNVFWDTQWWPNDDLFLQRYTLEGEQVWEEHLEVSELNTQKVRWGIIESDNNSNIIVWGENRAPAGMYAQKIDEQGNKLWNNDKFIGSQIWESTVITDGNNGAIIVWNNSGGIYAQQISKNGNLGEIITSVNEDNNNINPGSFYLTQNYPNPFNPVTVIKYEIPGQARNDNINVQLKVYDILGKEVATLINEEKPAGNYEVTFDASALSSGIYFYRLQAGSFIEVKKMILLK